LQEVFDHPPTYGKGYNWVDPLYATPYDAAQLIIRYVKSLPDPIVPGAYYHRFSRVLIEQPLVEQQVKLYRHLITEIPPLNRQLLLYILDMLAVIVSKSDENHVSGAALTEQFRSGILRNPQVGDLAHVGIEVNVIDFLIANQDSFLIGFESSQEAREVNQNMAG
jgi:hypothetical protein